MSSGNDRLMLVASAPAVCLANDGMISYDFAKSRRISRSSSSVHPRTTMRLSLFGSPTNTVAGPELRDRLACQIHQMQMIARTAARTRDNRLLMTEARE